MSAYLVVLAPTARDVVLRLDDQEREALATCLREELTDDPQRPRGEIANAPAGYLAVPLSNGWISIVRSLSPKELASVGRDRDRKHRKGFLVADLLSPTGHA